jgi:non-ribosomal peptide synthetase component F
MPLNPHTTTRAHRLGSVEDKQALKQPEISLKQDLSLVFGPTNVPLWTISLGALIEQQAKQYSERIAAVFPWQGVRLTYRQLCDRSKIVAKSILEAGLKNGDCVGIMAGNRYEYIEVLLGAGRIGCPVVVLNNSYTAQELLNAISLTRKFIALIHLYH